YIQTDTTGRAAMQYLQWLEFYLLAPAVAAVIVLNSGAMASLIGDGYAAEFPGGKWPGKRGGSPGQVRSGARRALENAPRQPVNDVFARVSVNHRGRRVQQNPTCPVAGERGRRAWPGIPAPIPGKKAPPGKGGAREDT